MPRLLLLTLVESIGAVLVQRGVYFYTADKLAFTSTQNLLLALGLGGSYVVGALASGRLTARLSEKQTLIAVLLGQLVFLMAIFLRPQGWVLCVGAAVYNGFNGVKWPIVESYVSAGRTPRQAAQAIGVFNIVWATTVPTALILCGQIIAVWAPGLFLLAALCSVFTFFLLPALPARPTHLPMDHPERLPAAMLIRLGALLRSSRWSMLHSYALLFLLSPLMPEIFDRLGFGVRAATALAAGVDITRVLAFIALRHYAGWHGRAAYLVAIAPALPLGFAMIMFADHLAIVLVGEVVFGLATGMSYFAALYYGMVVEDASVGAGGIHEAMIGSGFLAGPALGLAGRWLGPWLGSNVLGMALAVAPVAGLLTVASLWPLWRARRAPIIDDTTTPAGAEPAIGADVPA